MGWKGTDPRQLVHTPLQLSRTYVEYAQGLIDRPGIKWGVEKLDRELLPMPGGTKVGIMSRPGHGKTTMSVALARNAALSLLQEGRAEKEVVVFVALEEPVEKIEGLFQVRPDRVGPNVSQIRRGEADMEAIRANAARRLQLPVFILGRSVVRRNAIPPMSVDNLFRALDFMESEYGVKPALIVFDYIQLIHVAREADRVERITEAVHRAGDMAVYMDCPIIVTIQADRRVDSYDVKLPRMGDAQWSSAIEQSLDDLISLWRPAATDLGEEIEINGRKIEINAGTENLLLVKILKQRGERAGKIIELLLAPQWVRLEEAQIVNIPLNE